MTRDPKPNADLETILAILKADEQDEATYQLPAATQDEDEGEAVETWSDCLAHPPG